MNVLAAKALPLSRNRLAIIAGLVIALCLVVLAAVNIAKRPAVPNSRLAPDPSTLARLPALPEDIEAHGQAATSVLPVDEARRANAAVPFATGTLDVARPFAFKGSADDHAKALGCLAAAVLYEAGDDTTGQEAVAQVVLNRVRHAAFPATVCGVVYQGSARSTGCQFTFTCDGALRRVMPVAMWGRARAVAERALDGRVDAAVGLATHYHTDWVYPYWSPSLRKLARVGTHLFFGWPGSWGGPLGFGRAYRGGEPDVSVPASITDSLVAEATAEPGAPGGEDSAVPGLGGFRLVPAALPSGLEHVPLYGNKLRLSRADGRAFGLLTGPGATAAKLVNTALALCGKPGPCVVQAWGHEDDVPGAYPIPAATRDTMVFEYVRGGPGGGAMHFDCARFPNRDPKLCLAKSAAE